MFKPRASFFAAASGLRADRRFHSSAFLYLCFIYRILTAALIPVTAVSFPRLMASASSYRRLSALRYLLHDSMQAIHHSPWW